MDLARTLVRSVVRAFYDTKHILVVDALVIHSALRDDDLAYLMNMNTKDLHKLCGRLKEDRFLTVHTRPELKEGQQRPVNRMYYFIDYRQTIDAIKWRVYTVDKQMQGVTVPADERKEYFCLRVGCKKEYSLMEVLDKPSARGFLCHDCGSVLKHDPDGGGGGHKQSTRMNDQFKFITGMLPQIDSVVVPECTFDLAYNAARPVVRDALHKVVASVAVEPTHRQAAVKGLADTGPKSIDINLLSANGPSEADKEAERQRKAKHAEQNALPSWIAQSTISGDAYELDPARTGALAGAVASTTTTETKKDALDAKDHAEIDDYFAKLAKEQEAEAARKAAEAEEEEDDDDDEDDEGMFEDVVTGGTPAVETPKSSLKREASAGSEDKPAKKVKVEEPAPTVSAADTAGGDESDDEIEFEDV
ncbi:hypothetical protein PpBr36_07381 [Pyricularia pennisetigena]|uniref:hypothetical protein n=1 Tax=Pyricularia pennisetigena TaxID=1578925 RepID=UPI001154B885|nr:hypothetical protein PpBr36_07381 [Pyricularia pennisetigena]TLS25249.1 hypothetical protein PpBr36_07381 [Pyricularia pennisetigena]